MTHGVQFFVYRLRLPSALKIDYGWVMRVGDVIDDRFVLEKKAGAGGMGVVFRAFDRISGSSVALKAVHESEGEFDRFSREIAALERIAHPRVVRYIAHGGAGEGRYLAMEWLEGEDLAQRLKAGPLGLEGTLIVIRGIAEALAALHAADIVHRDIKPSNVFLANGDLGQVKLLDLGIARTHDVEWTLTATGALLGTPAYMAPEQARGESVDARADLFALGCIFYECLVGQTPFAAAHPVASLARILVEDVPRLRDSGVSVPQGVESVVESLLVKDRELRLPSALRVLETLGRLDNLKSVPPEKPASLTLGEQQVVSVVLTRPATGTDATSDARMDGTMAKRAKSLAERHGAALEQLPNGSYIAIFSGPTSPRDLAAHAASFALEIAALWGDDAIALTTGRGEISGRLPIGAAIDRAVSLLRGNFSGILVDTVSASLLEGRFQLATNDDRCQLVAIIDGRDKRRTVAGQTSLFVGREREISAIVSAWKTCMDEPLASVVLVTAPAGTGKSRLIDEILQSTALWDGIALTFMGGCDMMNAGARYGVLARAIRSDVHAESGDRAVRRDWLVERIRSFSALADAERTIELIAESCDLLDGSEGSPALRALRDNPLLLADAITEAWCSWLDAESAQGAVVFILEDLHWGDRPTINLIERLLRVLSDRPIFVLATARPEIHELFPNLWVDRGVQEIRLGRIPVRSTERLAKRFLGTHATDELIKRIVERSAGHPFLLEELVRAALANPSKFDDIPDTVLGMIQARFFGQTERARAALRAASIFGPTFWLHGVEHLLGDTNLENEFQALVRAEFIERSRSSKFSSDVAYSFRHALVRDAAYAMLTDIDRRTGHLLAGEWLEHAGERESLLLAQHFDLGAHKARAAYWYHRAGEDAIEGSDLGGAIRWAKRAIECGREGEELAMTELLLADATFGKGDMRGAADYGISGRSRLKPGTDAWFSATSLIIGSLGQLGLNEDVLDALESAIAVTTTPPTDAQFICIARGIGQYVWVSRERMEPIHERLLELVAQAEPGPLARGWLARVESEMLPYRWYLPLETARRCEIAAMHFEQAGAIRDAMMTRLFGVIQLAYTDRANDAVDIVRKMITDIDKRGLVYLGYFARSVQGSALFYSGRDQECSALIEPMVPKYKNSVRLYCTGHMLIGLIALDAGNLEKAHASSSEIIALENLSDSGMFSACGLHACVLKALGRIDEAVEWGEKAFEYSTPGFMDAFGEVTYIGLTEAYIAQGNRMQARKVVGEFWDMISTVPIEEHEYPRKRILQRLVKLADILDVPRKKYR